MLGGIFNLKEEDIFSFVHFYESSIFWYVFYMHISAEINFS